MDIRSTLLAKRIHTEEGLLVRSDASARGPTDVFHRQQSLGTDPKLMLSDISRAYMHARTASGVYVDLCG